MMQGFAELSERLRGINETTEKAKKILKESLRTQQQALESIKKQTLTTNEQAENLERISETLKSKTSYVAATNKDPKKLN